MIGDDLRKRLALISSLAAVLLAGCGGAASQHQRVDISAPSHSCSTADYYMQCALPVPPQVVAAPRGAQTGADFGWSSVSPATAKAHDWKFVASYLSLDPSKDFTPGTVRAFHADGIATVDVWETSAARVQDGFAAGEQDAREAQSQAREIGNTKRPIEFAEDCDCTPSSALAYFQGADRILGVSRVDAYGGYDQVLYLYQHHVVGHQNFQTYAWSDGRWLSPKIAPLEQYQNGSAYDLDRALARDYGQSPAPKPPLPRCIHRRMSHAACARAELAIDHAVYAAASSQRAYIARGCSVLSQREHWFAGHLKHHPRVKATSRRRALHATKAALRQRSCAKFAQRERYFTAKATELKAAS